MPPIKEYDFWSDVLAVIILAVRKVLHSYMGW
jgi:hypothetical protein